MNFFRNINFLSCRRFTELDSIKSHKDLTLWNKIIHGFHYSICLVCRRYSRQVELIQTISRNGLENQSIKLSKEAKDKIEEKIKQNL